MTDRPTEHPDNAGEFARTAAQDKSPGLLADVWDLLRHNKKWWLTPIVLALLLIGVLVALGSTAAAPFVYTLF